MNCVVFAAFLFCVFALPNGLGKTPQMGYSSWMDTSTSITEDRIKYIANALVDTGLTRLGYVYVNVDAGWLKGRDAAGNMYWDSVKFPSGMKALGDFLHGLGLKYGLYTTRGTIQCGTSEYKNVPGSYGYYKQDIDLMTSWGMDYLKVDSCDAPQDPSSAFAQYGQIRDALNATGRPVFFSLCGWYPWYAPVGNTLGNSWRIHGDGDNWNALSDAINYNADLVKYAGPGGWNDPDLLLGDGTGSYGPDRQGWYQTDLQSRSQFSMWCVMSSPLLISADILSVSPYAFTTWSNSEAIAVNQDLGRYPTFPYQGFRLAGGNITGNSGTNVWGKALSDGSFALVYLNNNPNDEDIVCDPSCFAQLKFNQNIKLVVRDLWLHQNIGTTTPSTGFTGKNVQGKGGCTFLRFIPS